MEIMTFVGKEPVYIKARKPKSGSVGSDRLIVNEVFLENVYDINEGSFDDTGNCMDLGANIGSFSIYAGKSGAKKIFSFEPESENIKYFKENLKMNNLEADLFDVAVSDKKGIDYISKNQGCSTLDSVNNQEDNREEVETITLAEAVKATGEVYFDVLKMDVEGSEYDIIRESSFDTINKFRYITMEFHNTTSRKFGEMISKLSMSHNIHIIGRYDYGGQIYATRF